MPDKDEKTKNGEEYGRSSRYVTPPALSMATMTQQSDTVTEQLPAAERAMHSEQRPSQSTPATPKIKP